MATNHARAKESPSKEWVDRDRQQERKRKQTNVHERAIAQEKEKNSERLDIKRNIVVPTIKHFKSTQGIIIACRVRFSLLPLVMSLTSCAFIVCVSFTVKCEASFLSHKYTTCSPLISSSSQ